MYINNNYSSSANTGTNIIFVCPSKNITDLL